MGLMHGLDLFSGIGGLSLALKPWVRSVAYCERDTYAQSVLLSRIATGELDRAPIWDDITSLDGWMLPKLDIIFGGFPCQDISVAGRGAGLDGERSGLYFEVERLIKETRPTFVFLENVPAIRTRGLGRVVGGLAELGYDCRWTVVSAESVGAPHLRNRWFLLAADTDRIGLRKEQRSQLKRSRKISRPLESHRKSSPREPTESPRWASQPRVSRANDGIPLSVDRARCLGNAVVPLQAQTAFKILAGLKC